VYSRSAQTVIQNSINAQDGLTPAPYHVIFTQQIPSEDVFSVSDDGTTHVLPNATNTDSLYLGYGANNIPDPEMVEQLLSPDDLFTGESGGEGGIGAGEPPAPPEGAPGASEGHPAPPGDIYQQTWEYRQQILDAIAGAQEALALRLGPAAEQIQGELMALAA